MVFVILAGLVVLGMFLSLLMENDKLSTEQFDEGIKKILEDGGEGREKV